jgi:glutamine synthetase
MVLIHEKPFAGINGSGKHNNWSMGTDDGENLLEPGNDPHANAQFLAFLTAVISGVDTHADLLRAAIADAGNDHRLGANEAPPAIMSIFLGTQLVDIVGQLANGAASTSKQGGTLELGATSLPIIPRDATDRNRTSPFAFTGNKFEFRAVGSSAPIYWPQTILNTAVADALGDLAGELDKVEAGDFAGLTEVLSGLIKSHDKVLFEGNNYSDEWHAEAARRGLPNNRSTVDALPSFTEEKAIDLFSRLGVLSERELRARAGILWERYVKISDIEASCSLELARTMIVPASVRYLAELSSAGTSKTVVAISEAVASALDALGEAITKLEVAHHAAHEEESVEAEARAYRDKVIPAQEVLRDAADTLETLVADDLWPLPKYRELLFQY